MMKRKHAKAVCAIFMVAVGIGVSVSAKGSQINLQQYEADIWAEESDEIHNAYISASEMVVDKELVETLQIEMSRDRIFTDVVSSDFYETHELRWEYCDAAWNDLLTEIDGDIFYYYDESGNRVRKETNGNVTEIFYNELGYILGQQNESGYLEFAYTNRGILAGFWFNDELYLYEFDENNLIIGIECNDEKIVSYLYDNGLISIEGTELEIGEINPIRYKSDYYDNETGWIYNGRYYDPVEQQYVDGLNDEEMEIYVENYGFEPEILYHMQNVVNSTKPYTKYPTKIEVIARTIRGEAGPLSNDIIAVACVIRNRYKTGGYYGSSAYEVVTKKDQFSAYKDENGNHSDAYNAFDMYATDKNSKMIVQLACDLYYERPLTYDLSYMDSQLFFCSLASAETSITGSGTNLRKNGRPIYNVRTVWSGDTDIEYSTLMNYCRLYKNSSLFNVYFNY